MENEILQDDFKKGGFERARTIREMLDMIESKELVLPAIQRDFVWEADQVVRLFDSLMKGYPISSFLFWKADTKAVGDYKFYEFLREYRQSFKTHGDECDPKNGPSTRLAVLDGQQRLTSLYIGFCGSYAWKGYKKHWDDDSESARPTRKLYLNLSETLNESEEEDARVYQFEFKTKEETKGWGDLIEDRAGKHWFRVGKATELDSFKLLRYCLQDDFLKESELAQGLLTKLHTLLTDAKVINYYQVEDNDLHKALNIFVRVNSCGTPLGLSDIILSIAISYWKGDAKRAFEELIHYIASHQNFNIGHEFILKAFLVLHSEDIRFKASNFRKDTALNLEKNWNDLGESIKATFVLAYEFGYSAESLLSYNALIPITYYIYKKRIWANVHNSKAFEHDRWAMNRWLHIVNVSRVFGYSGDATLRTCRKSLNQALEQGGGFPARLILRDLGVSFSEEDIEDLLKLQKHDKRAFPVLALLFPGLDFRNHNFHKDHMHADATIAGYRAETEVPEEELEYYKNPEWWNSLRNLQLLDANENQSKQDISLKDWIKHEVEDNHKDRDLLMQRCYIPTDVDLDISNLKAFLLARGELLRRALREKLTIPEE